MFDKEYKNQGQRIKDKHLNIFYPLEILALNIVTNKMLILWKHIVVYGSTQRYTFASKK
jgi:hypothetical protein